MNETEKEIKQLQKRLSELADKSFNQNMYTFTGFLGLSDQAVFCDMEKELAYAGAQLFGGNPDCERKMLRFGKEENLQELKEKTPIMLELYRSYKQLLLPYIDKEETSKKTVPADERISCLQQIHQYVDTFDLDGVDRVMKQLDEYRVPACIQDHMEKLRICVADVAMEDIMNLTTTMVDLLRE